MPHATDETENSTNASSGPRRIILCFDGTGNHFQGNESDTNIVKIYQMLDRHKEGQFHYYQREFPTQSFVRILLAKHLGSRDWYLHQRSR
jgi:uncharacterized protein (DUF2235 family)